MRLDFNQYVLNFDHELFFGNYAMVILFKRFFTICSISDTYKRRLEYCSWTPFPVSVPPSPPPFILMRGFTFLLFQSSSTSLIFCNSSKLSNGLRLQWYSCSKLDLAPFCLCEKKRHLSAASFWSPINGSHRLCKYTRARGMLLYL